MIVHQRIGMQAHTDFLQTFSEPMELGLIVLFGNKASRTVVIMPDNVAWVGGNMHTEASRHALSVARELNRAWLL